MKKSTIATIIVVVLVIIALIWSARMANTPDNSPAVPAEGNANTGNGSDGGTDSVTAQQLQGRWVGPEGTSLSVEYIPSTAPRKYRLNFVMLDGPISVIGDETTDGKGITFTRNFETLTLHHGTGADTGMKWLADKNDCIVVKNSEGYCRDGLTPAQSAVPGVASTTPPTAGAATGLSASLDGKTFRLTSFNGKAVTAVTGDNGQNSTVAFKGNQINAKFCNGMGGTYALTNTVMKASMIGTMMYCTTPVGLMDYEQQFGAMLNTGATVSLSGNTLTFAGADSKKMVFTKI